MAKPVIYLAGPYSKPDPMVNINRAVAWADKLVDCCVPLIPHTLTGFWHLVSPKPYEFWLDLDLAWLERCDGLFRMPGESSGADGEVAHARDNGIRVFRWERELRDWIDEFWDG